MASQSVGDSRMGNEPSGELHASKALDDEPPQDREKILERTNAKPRATDSRIPNIIIFGETGGGKSSLINMLANKEVAKVSNQAAGCTPSCEQHVILSPGSDDVEPGEYRIWDTPGLNEGDGGTVPSPKAFDHLVQLVSDHGVNLLIHCIRGPRLKDIFRVNYDLIWGIICQGKVPIVVVVTGLEDEHDRDVWWTENREEFERRGMRFSGQACVMIRRRLSQGDPSLRTDSEEYRKSAAKLWTLIQGNCVRNAWTPKDTVEWSAEVDCTMKEYMVRYNARTMDEREVLLAAAKHTSLSDRISDWLRLLFTSVMGSK